MSSADSNGANGASASNGISPKITLYTNHGCPWAHRAHITLRALNIPYEEVIIPLDRPREPWYLEINPRGLVPSLKISNGILKDEIIIESAIVSTFIADLYPSPTFWPASHSTPTAALERARINFFVDTFIGKVNARMYAFYQIEGEEKERMATEMVKTVEKEIEPLLEGAAPFFGGSETLTLAEALTASFVVRYRASAEHGLMPKSILEGLDALPNYSRWSKAIHEQDAVMYIFDGPSFASATAKRIEKMKAEAK